MQLQRGERQVANQATFIRRLAPGPTAGHVEHGKDLFEASVVGTREVAGAVAASTATTVAAFLPLVFWSGIGQTYLIGFFGAELREAFSLTDGQYGRIYGLATFASGLLRSRPLI